MGSAFNGRRKYGVAASKLTDKMRIYIGEYAANGCDGVSAAIAAGCSRKSAATMSSKWQRHPLVSKALRRVGTELLDSKRDRAREVLEQLFRLLQFNLMEVSKRSKAKGGYLEIDAEQYETITPIIGDCVTEVEFVTVNYDDGRSENKFRLKLMSKDRALELAMKYCELLTDKQDVTHKLAIDWNGLYNPSANGVPNSVEERLKQEEVLEGTVVKSVEGA